MNMNDIKNKSIEIARSYGHQYVLLDHLMLVLLDDDECCTTLEQFDVDVAKLKEGTIAALKSLHSQEVKELPQLSINVKRVLANCTLMRGSAISVTIADVLSSVFDVIAQDIEDGDSNFVICDIVEDVFALNNGLVKWVTGGQAGFEKADEEEPQKTQDNSSSNAFTDGSKTEKLFTQLQANNETLVSHKNSINLILHTLGQNTDALCVIVGDNFSGKTSVIQEIVNQANDEALDLPISGLKFLTMNINRAMMSVTSDAGRNINSAIKAAEREGAILVIDDLNNLVSQMYEQNIGVLLQRAARKGVKILCSIDPNGYSKVFESLESDSVSKVILKEPSHEEICFLVERELSDQTMIYGITYEEDLPKKCVSIAKGHFHGNLLAATYRILNRATSIAVGSSAKEVETKHIEDAVCEIKGISRSDLDLTTNQIVMGLADRLKKNIYGQDESIDKLSRIVRTSKMGFKENEAKPNACVMMMGTTGTGKTETATQMAKELGVELVRLDMSEYQESHTISKLLGAPAGYIGHNDGDGILYEHISKKPDAVVLFDEIEKAHPAIFRLLLGAMDYGILTTNTNKQVVFKDTFIMFTTNIGVETIQNGGMQIDAPERSESVSINQSEYKRFFSSEFRNRIDLLLTFNTLNKDIALKIADKVTKRVAASLKKLQNIELIVEESAAKLLVDHHFNNVDGARTISRGFQNDISNLVIDELILAEDENKKTKGNAMRVIVSATNNSYNVELQH
ncbi:AAA family ATPase [Vibrio sp. D431a]|uniref:AAA family ATPase n=1 Tax=Vibrio sp. D431a TaxID=2837388 RepID=UPI002556B3F8|nr:AAA family ATPase [Vibrio sp. D431a]MDK9790625.1 AAA family ATPase [Vibrio sp. D431a]